MSRARRRIALGLVAIAVAAVLGAGACQPGETAAAPTETRIGATYQADAEGTREALATRVALLNRCLSPAEIKRMLEAFEQDADRILAEAEAHYEAGGAGRL